ncbi:MAG: hypothetical protein WCS69_16180 [Ignavibacteriaceae bacterium]|jgi:hypothetical protein
MNTINEYLNRTKSAVEKLFDANYSYMELLEYPERPVFSYWGEIESEENTKAYLEWCEENKGVIELRIKKDNEFQYEHFAKTTFAGTILQFAFWGIEKFSINKEITNGFEDIINSGDKAEKFCIGRICDDLPIGLIIYAGRNQAFHFYEDKLRRISQRVFDKLSTWYSPRYKKWYKRDQFDLNNPGIINYAENILHTLEWTNYEDYEKDMINML